MSDRDPRAIRGFVDITCFFTHIKDNIADFPLLTFSVKSAKLDINIVKKRGEMQRMNDKNCGKRMNSILNRKMEEDTVLEKRENQEHLFPLLWILGFSILSEILLFVMQRLGRSLIEWMQAFVPEGIAPLLISDLTAALSALFPLLIFAIGIRLYALGRKEQLPRQVRIVAVALFLCGHTAAAALSGVLVSFFWLCAGLLLELSASNASLAGTILSLLLRISFDTAAVGWGLRQYELSR